MDPDEQDAEIEIEGVLKICKVLLYKIGMTYKRMDIYANDIKTEFKEHMDKTLGGVRKDLD